MTQKSDLTLDVRTREEWQEEHSPTAINIPLDELEQRENELSTYKDKHLVVVCRSGNRAGMAISFLQQKGYSNLENGGGWQTQQ